MTTSFHTRVELDIEGNQRTVRDAIGQNGDAQGRVVMRYDYDMLGNRIHQASMDGGGRWMLNDVTGNPIRAWDSRNHEFRSTYDELRRPIESYMSEDGDPVLVEQTVYGETRFNPEANNLRGEVVQLFDQAGVVTRENYDFEGNLLSSSRQLAQEYKTTLDWSAAVTLEIETYTSHTNYDALNRPIQLIAPRSDQPGAKRNVIQPIYNEENLLERVDVWLDYPNEPSAILDPGTEPPSPVGVNNIDYDAKGQRLRIDYKNGATTFYDYDPETFRLICLYTRRGTVFSEDCGNNPPPPHFSAPDIPPPSTPCGLQNLHYTYDPAGNITQIRDDAQQTIYFRNRRVEPDNHYTYDALYRLIEATGREHLGQIGGAPIPHSYNDASHAGLLHPGDGNAMGTYIERYVYDAVGNFLEMQHRGSDPAHRGWSCSYDYTETSLIEDGTGETLTKTSNRLSRTIVKTNGAMPFQEVYAHDPHGNMRQMPQLHTMQWDYRDQLQMTQRQKVNDGDVVGMARHGERTYYVYDAAGERVRKVTELANGDLKDERIYLGGFEIYRKHTGSDAGLVTETLHIIDDQQRIALVETHTQGTDPVPAKLIRYQFGNYLGSGSLELDDKAKIISYEEYTPYGSTSYQAVRSLTETPKRYRYTGKERDEESGLNYHGARYYAAWLGRWISSDPAGLVDGSNAYRYVSDNPLRSTDPSGTQAEDPVVYISGYRIRVATKEWKAVKSFIPKAKKADLPVAMFDYVLSTYAVTGTSKKVSFIHPQKDILYLNYNKVKVIQQAQLDEYNWSYESPSIAELYHELTHAYFDLNSKAKKILRKAKNYYSGTPLLGGGIVKDSDRAANEAVAMYVEHRVKTWWESIEELKLIQKLMLRAPSDRARHVTRAREIRDDYNFQMKKRVFGYDEGIFVKSLGLIYEKRLLTAKIPESLKNFIDKEMLENKVPDRFDEASLLRKEYKAILDLSRQFDIAESKILPEIKKAMKCLECNVYLQGL